MPFVNAELSRRSRSGEVPQYALGATSASPITTTQRDALKFDVEVDRNTVWPTHRIRCFLLSQQNAASWAASR